MQDQPTEASQLSTDVGQEADPFAEASEKSGSGGGLAIFLAVLALLVAIAAAGWNGWQWWLAQGETDSQVDTERALAAARESREALQASAAELDRRLAALEKSGIAADLAALETRIGEVSSVEGAHRRRIEALESSQEEILARLSGVESGLSALVVRGEAPSLQLEMEEVDYLLRSANERAQLYGDVETAGRALALADQQLRALDDPLYLPVRREIAAALGALEELPEFDPVRLTEALAREQARIGSLPVLGGRLGEAPEAGPAPNTGALPEDASLWQRFKATMTGLVTVRRRVADEDLMSIGDREYVRQGLWLQLETARLALLRRDPAMYRAAVERALAALDQWFDRDAPAVQRSRQNLRELLAEPLASDAPPDLSGPWTELQRLRSVRPRSPDPADPDSGQETPRSSGDATDDSPADPPRNLPPELPSDRPAEPPAPVT